MTAGPRAEPYLIKLSRGERTYNTATRKKRADDHSHSSDRTGTSPELLETPAAYPCSSTQVSTLIGLIMVALPELFTSFSKIHGLLGTAGERGGLERLYKRISTASFSDEALERYPINLGVLPVHGIEWSDLSGSWLFCPAWEFIPNGRLPSRYHIGRLSGALRSWRLPAADAMSPWIHT
jgi:hypothetical protein